MRITKIMKRRHTYYLLMPLLLLLLIPFIGAPVYILSFLILIFMYITFGESWNILGGLAGYSNWGHSAFFGIGAYVTAILLRDYGLSPFFTTPIAGFVAAMVAVVVCYPFIKLKGIYFALGTIPITKIFMLLTLLLPYTGGAEGIMLPIPPFDPVITEIIFYELMLLAMLLTIFVLYKISRSKFGIGLVSIREDEDAARVLGVHTTRLKLLALAISTFLIAIVGGIYSYYTLFIDASTVFSFKILLYTMGIVYLGGVGTILGPILGGGIFIFLSEYLRFAIGVAYEGLHLVIFGSIILLIILFMPEGIVGWLKKKYPNSRLIF